MLEIESRRAKRQISANEYDETIAFPTYTANKR